jgi:hypothetical protein
MRDRATVAQTGSLLYRSLATANIVRTAADRQSAKQHTNCLRYERRRQVLGA